MDGNINSHFWRFNRSPACFNLVKTFHGVLMCSSSDLPVTKISSMYTETLGIPCNIVSIVRWKIEGAEAIPKGNLVYWYRPLTMCVLIVVYFFESSAIWICWYAWAKSSFVNVLPPASDARMSSILGSGNIRWCNLVHRNLVVTTYTHCFVRLDYWNNWSSPAWMLYWF